MTTTEGDRRPLWWLVLAGGSFMILAALVMGLTSRGAADFGQVALQQVSSESSAQPTAGPATESARPTQSSGADDDTATTAPQPPAQAPPRTVPLVPPDARRPAQATPDATNPPVGLRIPALDLGVDVVPVGVDDEGQMEIPESGQDVGWYRYGAAPGQSEGSAVLASHVDTLAEGKGVLARLGELRAGDIVAVTLDDGSVVDYEVTGRRTVPKVDLDVRALFDRSGPARLALVTCGGPWLPEESSYRDNVIVTAEPVTPSS